MTNEVQAKPSGIRVLGAYRNNAAGYYRIVAPFSVLRYRTPHTFDVHAPTVDDAAEYDVLWLHQHADATTELIAHTFLAAGRRVVYDVDDWLLGLPPSWPCYGDYFDRGSGQWRERLVFHERLLKLATIVTCTTPRLAENLREWLPNADVRILPNAIVQGEWDTVIHGEHHLDGPVLGWFGTENHWDDWTEIVGAVDVALEEVGGYLALIGAPELAAMFPARLAKRTHFYPLVPFKRFGEMRRLITSFDVGLAWCTDRLEANRCRSPLKALQYGAAGIPIVASETVYGDLAGWSVDDHLWSRHLYGTTIKTPQGLAEALCYTFTAITRNPAVRQSAQNWQNQVWLSHSYEKQALRWMGMVNELTGGK